VRHSFDYHSACRIVQLFKMSGPTFGGVKKRPLGVSFRLALPGGKATVVIKRGKRTVKRVTFKNPGVRVHRVKLPAAEARRADYRATITATIGRRSQKRTLVSRRI